MVSSYVSVLNRKEIQEKVSSDSENNKNFIEKYILSKCKKDEVNHPIGVDIKLIRTDWLFTKQNYSTKGNDFL